MVIACANRDKYDARLWPFKYVYVHVPLQAKGHYQPEGSPSRKYDENSAPYAGFGMSSLQGGNRDCLLIEKGANHEAPFHIEILLSKRKHSAHPSS